MKIAAKIDTVSVRDQMLPTVAEVLDLEVVRRGRPEVLAAGQHLGARVRWVHAIELADVSRLLQGGELVLSTGIALPDDPALLAAYVADLSAAGVSGPGYPVVKWYSASCSSGFSFGSSLMIGNGGFA